MAAKKEKTKAKSPVKGVSKYGVAEYHPGMHPRTRRIEAEKAAAEGTGKGGTEEVDGTRSEE